MFDTADMTVGGCVRANSLNDGARPAFLTATTTMSWTGYDHAADRVSAQLVAVGVERGHRVAVVMPDGPAVHATFVGVERIGAVVVGIGFRAGLQEVEHLVAKTEASVLVLEEGRRSD